MAMALQESTRKILALTAVIAHLSLVVAFLYAEIGENGSDALSHTLRLYKNFTGLFRDYRYFAPSVGSEFKAGFLVEDRKGASRFTSLESDRREISLRYNVVVSACMRDVRGRDLFAQSWAAFVLGNDPEAQQVTIVVKRLIVPTLAAYRTGEQPYWANIYAATFGRL
jgi:hypothetical protein